MCVVVRIVGIVLLNLKNIYLCRPSLVQAVVHSIGIAINAFKASEILQ